MLPSPSFGQKEVLTQQRLKPIIASEVTAHGRSERSSNTTKIETVNENEITEINSCQKEVLTQQRLKLKCNVANST